MLQFVEHRFDGFVVVRERLADAGRQAQLREMKEIVNRTASELGIANEVLASRRDLVSLIEGESDCRLSTGWRQEVVGSELRSLL